MRYMRTRLMIRRVFGPTLTLFLLLVAACSTATNSGNAAAPITQKCGAVHTQRSLVVSMDWSMAKGVEDCFWQAFQQCGPATLIYSQSDSEASTIHTFSLQSEKGPCLITDSVQHFLAPHPPQSAINYTCTDLQRQTNGLHFLSCGTLGNIFVPTVGTHK